MNPAAAARRRKFKAGLAWAFWAINLAVIVGFWLVGNRSLLASGDIGTVLLAIARLTGLVATFCVLTQFVVIGRQGWLEPIFGLDKLAIFHRRNGIVALCLILLHPALMSTAQGILVGNDPITQYFVLQNLAFISLAGWGVFTFVVTILTSIYIVRKHLKFEWWYAVHLFNYVAISLVLWHQFAYGVGGPMRWYWIGIYVFALGGILVWRWLLPIVRSLSHDFRVERTEAATPTATSVYIAGRNLDTFKAKGGQFVLVRFMAKGFWWQEHPFSISQLPGDKHFRLTIRRLGDFTNKIPALKPGTRVIVSGPHGAFTHERQAKPKVLYIAGGIGITPIAAMIQERAGWSKPGDAMLLYGNRTEGDSALLDELKANAKKIGMPIHNVLSEQKDYKGETGYVDGEKIKRLVPDFKQRDIFLCGPPPMMAGIVDSLKQMGMSAEQVHYERFSLHK